jgi:hypothetical protein
MYINYLTRAFSPRVPISTTVSKEGSYKPSGLESIHSKLLLILRATSTTISLVSFPVITKGVSKAPVTKQEPNGMGETASKGFGTVVVGA